MIDFSNCLSYIYHLKTLTLFEKGLERIKGNGKTILSAKKPLDPTLIPKFKTPLAIPPTFSPLTLSTDQGTDYYVVDISEFEEQILPDRFPQTTVWGYGGFVKEKACGEAVYRRCSPGPTFEARRGNKIKVKWINRLYSPHLFAVDPTLHWANPNHMPMDPPKPWPKYPPGFCKAQWPVPVVTHVHGGENPPPSDGFPEAWFTYNDETGPDANQCFYTYPNRQEPATLWYHDHALGITRLNVYAGLAGLYLMRDPKLGFDDPDEDSYTVLPHGRYEIPLVIQDRSFYDDGSLAFTETGNNPDIHPYWNPEFFGDTILVNGRVWPCLKAERRKYRFRVLNGSNARFYQLFLSTDLPMWQIGTDGGYLDKPVPIHSLLLAPAERADIIVDFSCCGQGDKITLKNDAPAPYPSGNPVDTGTVGQILQFEIQKSAAVKEPLPTRLNKIPHLCPDAPARYFTLNEVMGENGPTAVLLNNQHWMDPVTERPRVGSTEDWIITNLTMDTHPIHLHLVQFLLVSRQAFDMQAYERACLGKESNGIPYPKEFATGEPILPEANENGWKDTVRMNPSEITTIRVRFSPQQAPVCSTSPGDNLYSFNPCEKPGYVWHCHILDHEDNDMMRPYEITE